MNYQVLKRVVFASAHDGFFLALHVQISIKEISVFPDLPFKTEECKSDFSPPT